MARSLVFYRATYGVRVIRREELPSGVIFEVKGKRYIRTGENRSDYKPLPDAPKPIDWTIRAFSFWHPVGSGVLRRKIEAVAAQKDVQILKNLGYEEEDVGSSESRGIGFYRWDVIDEDRHEEVARIHGDCVMRPDGSEVRWRK